jgi:hypothetical protein
MLRALHLRFCDMMCVAAASGMLIIRLFIRLLGVC